MERSGRERVVRNERVPFTCLSEEESLVFERLCRINVLQVEHKAFEGRAVPGLQQLCAFALNVPLRLAHIGHEQLCGGQIPEILQGMRIDALTAPRKLYPCIVERPDIFFARVIDRHVFIDRARTVRVIPPEKRREHHEVLLYREPAEYLVVKEQAPLMRAAEEIVQLQLSVVQTDQASDLFDPAVLKGCENTF